MFGVHRDPLFTPPRQSLVGYSKTFKDRYIFGRINVSRPHGLANEYLGQEGVLFSACEALDDRGGDDDCRKSYRGKEA